MSKGLLTVLIVLGVIVVSVFGFISWGSGIYDKAVRAQEEVNGAWANVQTMYQRRADLIPNLVASVKRASENEKAILTQVTQARAGIVNAKTPEDLEIAGRQINTAINLAYEAYPEIKSNENFRDLDVEITGSENRISVARTRYNEAVVEYNSYVRGFFKKWALGMFGGGEDFSVKKGFEASAAAQDAPDVGKAFDK